MLRWSFDAVVAAGFEQIIVVVPKDRVHATEDLLPEGGHVTAGGATRQASVRNGLSLVESDLVVVHDAARPFAPARVFAAILDALQTSDAVVPGLQMKETVKLVRDATVVQTLQREEIWNIQTPQGFKTGVLREAHRRAEADGFAGTDDAQLVENYGTRVRVVPGDPLAFKVTDRDDVRRAELVVAGKSS